MSLTRSEQMQRIKATNTSPELALRKSLWALGIRYRLHYRTPGGRADLAIPSARRAVFVDGCFWHGCPEHYVHPRSRSDFWDRKLEENVERDRRQVQRLLEAGWSFVRVWEHEVVEDLQAAREKVAAVLRGEQPTSFARERVIRVEPLDADGARERRYLIDLLDSTRSWCEEGGRRTAKTGRVARTPVGR